MKFLSKIKVFSKNIAALLESDAIPIGQRQINEMMQDQLGAGWIDRLMQVRGKLHPDTVEQTILNASSRTSGSLGKLYELMYYMTNDTRIGGMLDKRLEAVTRVNLSITPVRDNTTSVDAASFLEKYINDIKFKGFLEAAMDGKLYGVTAFHNIIMDVGSHYVFKDPTKENQISQSRWWQERSGDHRWGELYLKTTEGEKLYLNSENDIHPAQLSVFTYKQKRGYYDTTGLLNRLLRLYVLKVWLLVFISQSAERYGKPFIWTTLNEKQFNDEEFKGKVARVLKHFGAERWGIFPQGLDLEALNASSAVGNELQMKAVDFCNIEMAISILGQNLSTEVQGGSFAAAASHSKVEQRKTESDLEWLEEEINDQWIYWLMRINYPELDRDLYPKIGLSPIFDVDVEKVARGYKALTELVDVPVEEIRMKAQTRAPRVREDADEDSTGADRYDEEVVGPSTRGRATQADRLIRSLGG